MKGTIEIFIGGRYIENSHKFVFMRLITAIVLIGSVSFIFLSGCKGEVKQTTDEPRNLNDLLEKFPDSVELLLERGSLLFDEYAYDESMKDVAKAFRIDPTNTQARLLYAEALNNRQQRTVQDVATAQRHYFKVIEEEPKNVRALVGLAATFNFQQDFENTFKYVNEALRIDPKYRNAYVLKGTTYRQLGNMDLAKSSYETAVQQDPNFFEAYFSLGILYQAEKNPICIEYFSTALSLRPEILEVKYQLAYSRQIFNQIDGAIELYKEMAADTSEVYAARGLFHQAYIKQFVKNDIDSAIYYYKSALRTEPRYVESWHNMGLCFAAKGDKSRALEAFGKALEYDPEFELSREEANRLR